VLGENSKLVLQIPRDREGTFDPKLIGEIFGWLLTDAAMGRRACVGHVVCDARRDERPGYIT